MLVKLQTSFVPVCSTTAQGNSLSQSQIQVISHSLLLFLLVKELGKQRFVFGHHCYFDRKAVVPSELLVAKQLIEFENIELAIVKYCNSTLSLL